MMFKTGWGGDFEKIYIPDLEFLNAYLVLFYIHENLTDGLNNIKYIYVQKINV